MNSTPWRSLKQYVYCRGSQSLTELQWALIKNRTLIKQYLIPYFRYIDIFQQDTNFGEHIYWWWKESLWRCEGRKARRYKSGIFFIENDGSTVHRCRPLYRQRKSTEGHSYAGRSDLPTVCRCPISHRIQHIPPNRISHLHGFCWLSYDPRWEGRETPTSCLW